MLKNTNETKYFKNVLTCVSSLTALEVKGYLTFDKRYKTCTKVFFFFTSSVMNAFYTLLMLKGLRMAKNILNFFKVYNYCYWNIFIISILY